MEKGVEKLHRMENKLFIFNFIKDILFFSLWLGSKLFFSKKSQPHTLFGSCFFPFTLLINKSEYQELLHMTTRGTWVEECCKPHIKVKAVTHMVKMRKHSYEQIST